MVYHHSSAMRRNVLLRPGLLQDEMMVLYAMQSVCVFVVCAHVALIVGVIGSFVIRAVVTLEFRRRVTAHRELIRRERREREMSQEDDRK